MIVILVTGSREFTDEGMVDLVLRKTLTEFVPARPDDPKDYPTLREGEARGLDRIARDIWKGWGLPIDAMKPDWTTCEPDCTPETCQKAAGKTNACKRAAFRRNHEMVDKDPTPAVVLGFTVDWAPCRGTRDCMGYAEDQGLEVRHHIQHEQTMQGALDLVMDELGGQPIKTGI